MSEFVHLHVHSEYSLLDGLGKLDRLARRARELNMGSMALTDHGVMYGAVEWYRTAKDVGIKPIIGCETYVAAQDHRARNPQDKSPFHLTLLAANDEGYRNLMALVTKASLEGFYYKPRIDKDLIAEHSAGLIGLSGCVQGEVAQFLMNGDAKAAAEAAARYADILGKGNFYLELMDHGIDFQPNLNRQLVELSRRVGTPLVATNDVHYVNAVDWEAHDILLCIQTVTTVNQPNRMRMTSKEFYVRSAEEMETVFRDVPEALGNTLAVAERCNLQLDFSRLHLPEVDIPAGHTAETYLAELAWQGLRRRYPNPTTQIEQRLRHELAVIEDCGFSAYILIVLDLTTFARSRDILYGVRGSAAASIVCYCIGITDLDPMAYNLAFERFLNPERREMPDVDLDFADYRRGEMIEYVNRKYGEGHVAQIITFGTMGAKAAIRDVGRALGMSFGDADRVAKLVPSMPLGITIDQALQDSLELRGLSEADPAVERLLGYARSMEGVARNSSTHAAGVVISRDPLVQHVPLQRPAHGDGNSVTTQYPMYDLGKIGLLKMDFLGLVNLAILDRAVTLIEQTRGEKLDLLRIPLDDRTTYQLLSAGETTGVFQLEGAGMRRYVKELKPTCIGDLAAMVALYRPGPMAHIPTFIKGKRGEITPSYIHPALEPILSSTYGVIVYQDQVLFIVRAIAGFTLGQADILRRAMSKKVVEEMRRGRTQFMEKAQANGVAEGVAAAIFDMIEPFAGYAFNAAHAASYALVSYQTAYLKANYPVEYLAALLTSYMDVPDKVALGVGECRRLGVTVLSPDVTRSHTAFAVERDEQGELAVRFGLGAIKNLGQSVAEKLVEVREQGGVFTSLDDLCARVENKNLNKRALESLIKCGAMDCLGRRSRQLAGLDAAMSHGASTQKAQDVGQFSLFDLMPASNTAVAALPDVPDVPKQEQLSWEKHLLGVYVSEHPLQQVSKQLAGSVVPIGEITSEDANANVRVGGMVTQVRRVTTKKNDTMLYAQMEDLEGSIEIIVFPRTYMQTAELWKEDAILVVDGRVDVRDDKPQVICQEVRVFDPDAQPEPQVVREPPRRASARTSVAETAERYPVMQPSVEPTQRLEVVVPVSDDRGQDAERLDRALDLLKAEPGPIRFDIAVQTTYGLHWLDLPVCLTAWTPGLEQQLEALLGPGHVRLVRDTGQALHVQETAL